jgi:four helix bundle protein
MRNVERGGKMNHEEWEKAVPEAIKADAVWKMSVYRLALFLGDLGWYDVTKLMRDCRTIKLSDQLYRALGSISTNISEGYSRGTGKDRARFYEYALGSARESRDWYFKGRHILGNAVFQHRIALLTEIIRLLLTMIPQQRQNVIREESSLYETNPEDNMLSSVNWEDLNPLLHNIPLPG